MRLHLNVGFWCSLIDKDFIETAFEQCFQGLFLADNVWHHRTCTPRPQFLEAASHWAFMILLCTVVLTVQHWHDTFAHSRDALLEWSKRTGTGHGIVSSSGGDAKSDLVCASFLVGTSSGLSTGGNVSSLMTLRIWNLPPCLSQRTDRQSHCSPLRATC